MWRDAWTGRDGPRRLLVAALIMVGGICAWPLLGASFSRAFQASARTTLGALQYGAGGHTHFASAARPTASTAQRAESWDTQVALSIDGVEQVHTVSLNPRRLVYLPLLALLSLLTAAPIRPRAKLHGLLLGAPLLWGLGLGCVWVSAVWLFASVPRLVYDLSGWQSAALRLAYEGLVTSLASKFIVPLLLVMGLSVWRDGRVHRRG